MRLKKIYAPPLVLVGTVVLAAGCTTMPTSSFTHRVDPYAGRENEAARRLLAHLRGRTARWERWRLNNASKVYAA